MQYSQYFTDSYQQARQNFLASCETEAEFIRSWQHPLRGIAGEKLYLDLAWHGDLAAAKVLVLISGTHGIEGFCGSGIQAATVASGLHRRASQDVAILMIHGLNPWGMSHYRRVNEAGVDVNRNFWNFSQPLPENPLYRDLAQAIVPPEWTPETEQETFEQLFTYLAQDEKQSRNLAKGQYEYWYAPFYGGEVECWSNRTFQQIVKQYLQGKTVGLLDYHTGLGQYGTGQLMTMTQADAGDDLTSNLANQIWGDRVIITGSSNSVAPYKPHGTLIAALQDILHPSGCIAAAHEFGTIAETEVFAALRADHWLYLHGDIHSPQAKSIKDNMLKAFYSDRPDWQTSVCKLAFEAQIALLDYLNSL